MRGSFNLQRAAAQLIDELFARALDNPYLRQGDDGARLPALPIDPGTVTVSGLSAGGYMAVQFHVAYSSLVKGAGLVAGLLADVSIAAIAGMQVSAGVGASISSMRSICLSLLCACVAFVFFARKRFTNSIMCAISRC